MGFPTRVGIVIRGGSAPPVLAVVDGVPDCGTDGRGGAPAESDVFIVLWKLSFAASHNRILVSK